MAWCTHLMAGRVCFMAQGSTPNGWVRLMAQCTHLMAGSRVGVNYGIKWEFSSIPDSIEGIGLGIGIKKKGIGIE